MMLRDDRKLLDGFRSGSAAALRAVYLHYAPRVTAFLRGGFTFTSAGGSYRFRGYDRPYELENAVQEVFLRAFGERARLSYDGLRPFADYVLAIARNYTLNGLRRREGLIVPVEEIDRAAGESSDAVPFEASLEEREVDRLMAVFVSSLDVAARAYFAARFTDERNQVEAALALGITRIRARRIEAHIKRDLLTFMKQHGYLSGASASLAGALAAKVRA